MISACELYYLFNLYYNKNLPLLAKYQIMKIKFFITAALAGFTAICFAAVTGLADRWTGTLKTPDGNEFPLTYNFKTDSGKLTGTADSPQGTVNIQEGKITADSLHFSVMVNDMKVMHWGKYFAKGDSISMNMNFNGDEFHTTLKRGH